MTARRPCPPAPGPLEDYAARFDDLFFSLAQRRGFREYLTGLLAPRDRNKKITRLAGAEPVAGAGMPGVQHGKAAGFGCRAVVADCAYSVSDDWYLALREAGLAYVVAL